MSSVSVPFGRIYPPVVSVGTLPPLLRPDVSVIPLSPPPSDHPWRVGLGRSEEELRERETERNKDKEKGRGSSLASQQKS